MAWARSRNECARRTGSTGALQAALPLHRSGSRPQSRRIRQFAAIRADTGTSLRYDGGDLAAALAKLDALAEGAAFVLGHNVIAHDLPHLAAAQPDLGLLHLPAVDTLRLNPLAFPRNPYHHLVKHYQDGPLQGTG